MGRRTVDSDSEYWAAISAMVNTMSQAASQQALLQHKSCCPVCSRICAREPASRLAFESTKLPSVATPRTRGITASPPEETSGGISKELQIQCRSSHRTSSAICRWLTAIRPGGTII